MLKLVEYCERCAGTAVGAKHLAWEMPTSLSIEWPEHYLCELCLDVIMQEYTKNFKTSWTIQCPLCNKMMERDKMVFVKNENRIGLFCPECKDK